MSLLLDALKRAEQEKLARLAQELHAAESAAGEAPAPAPAAAPRRKLELERHEAAAAPEPASAPAPSAAAMRREREGAKVVFAAKQADPLPTVREPRGNRTMLAIAGVAVLLVLAGGAYVWYEINATPGSMIGPPRVASAPRPVTPAPPPSPITGTVAPAAPPALSAAAPAPAAPEAAPAAGKAAPKPAERVIAGLLKEGAEVPPPPLKLTRTIEVPRVSPDVKRGYDALVQGDADTARRAYEAALAADAANLDAHLGLAAVAARAGERAAAAGHYRRALALDPRNASALAGLAALADFTRAEGLEARLRADISRSPANAALSFTLGNLYASQSRWNEAQAAYFEAYRLDPGSADLAFNLAVSLDHLGQARLAADYYQRALDAARRQAPQFDRAQVSRRLAELKR